jgi:putative RecB family exonuclease
MTPQKSDHFRLSVSKSKEFKSCKAKYNFGYNLKLPQEEKDYLILGKFCHKVLEDFHGFYIQGTKDPYNVSMKKAWKNALAEFPEITPEIKAESNDIIQKYLKRIYEDKTGTSVTKVLACEKRFEILLDNKVVINGMIDRIDLDPDGVMHVADYKSSKSSKYLKNDFFQLLTYAYVMCCEDPTLEKVRASYIMLKHDFEWITFEFTKEQIIVIKDQYLKCAEEILKETEFKPNPTILCGWCSFISHCPTGTKFVNKFNGETEW